jgi:hypothetical protein
MLIEEIAPQSLAYLVTASGGCGLDRRSLRFSRVRSSASRTKSDCTRPKAVVVVRLPSFAAATLALADLLIFLLHAPNIELRISRARAGGPRHVDGVILDVIVSATSEYRGLLHAIAALVILPWLRKARCCPPTPDPQSAVIARHDPTNPVTCPPRTPAIPRLLPPCRESSATRPDTTRRRVGVTPA